jgi:phospho-N-acetylmuramoyl-pentapeptide-transferase
VLYYWFFPLADAWGVFNVFRYITFRSVYAAFTSLLICLVLGPLVIRAFKRGGVGQTIRKDGPDRHHSKAGPPTMGGLIILPAILVSIGLWARWEHYSVWLAVFSLVWFGAVGFLDDYLKWRGRNTKGLVAKGKLLAQAAGALAVMLLLLLFSKDWQMATAINVPFIKLPVILPVWLFVLFGMVVIVGACNAVNLTDGLDGLAIGSLAFVGATFIVMTYLVANFKFANYLKIIHVAGSGELTVVCSAMVGAALGFLWFNSHPAEIFMGDTGSLALGGMLGTLAVLTKQEILLFVVGGIFVAEALSVILQVASFKLTGKRIFLMAPLHHHFELKGLSESKIIIRFWIAAVMLAVITLSTLKLR